MITQTQLDSAAETLKQHLIQLDKARYPLKHCFRNPDNKDFTLKLNDDGTVTFVVESIYIVIRLGEKTASTTPNILPSIELKVNVPKDVATSLVNKLLDNKVMPDTQSDEITGTLNAIVEAKLFQSQPNEIVPNSTAEAATKSVPTIQSQQTS